MTDIDAQARVNRVAKVLDAHDPEWYKPERIDLAILKMHSYNTCVVGQSFLGARGTANAPYAPGLLERGVEFILGLDLDEDRAVLASFTPEWKRAILARRAADIAHGDAPSPLQARIEGLRRQGAGRALHVEVRRIRGAIKTALDGPEVTWDWVARQAQEAQAIEAAAKELQNA